MPKLGAAPPAPSKAKPKAKAAPKAKAKKSNKLVLEDDPTIFNSDDDEEQQEVVILMGEIGSGKTYVGGTASEFWPKKLPASKWTTLEDMLWLQIDRKAVAGFKGDKIKVRTFDFLRFMTFPDVYEEAGFREKPDFGQATEHACLKAVEFAGECFARGLRPKICIDSLTAWDQMHFRWSRREDKMLEASSSHNKYRKFDIHGTGSIDFLCSLIETGADLIFCVHPKAFKTESKGDKEKAIVVKVAGQDPESIPDLTGNMSPKAFKRHVTMQLNVRAFRGMGRNKDKVERELLIGSNAFGGEGKNRYERALAHLGGVQSPPNLGEIFRLVQK